MTFLSLSPKSFLHKKLVPASAAVLLVAVISGFGTHAALGAEGITIAWTNNMLTIRSPKLAGDHLDIWYLEAFCRSGSTRRDWNQTTIPHRTELLQADPKHLRLRTRVGPDVEVLHEIRAGKDDVDFRVELTNHGGQAADVQWFQPCMRVAHFTGLNQSNYIQRSFIFTRNGLTMLDQMPRAEEARYRGGQVYVPAGIPIEDVNPRPISSEQPVNGLIGCFSADGKSLVAMAWDQTQELFQGVIVCLHNDPRVGGLKPGEKKHLHGKVYLLPNNSETLVARYSADFKAKRFWR